MAAIAQSTLIQRVRDLLDENPWPVSFTGNITAGATIIPVPDGTLWAPQDQGEFQDNGEQFFVVSISVNNLTVSRGYKGTTAIAHNGSVTPIILFKRPVFTYLRIQDALELVMQSLWPYVWKKATVVITPDPNNKVWYDTDVTAIDIIQASQLTTGTPTSVFIYGNANPGIGNQGVSAIQPSTLRRILPYIFAQQLPAALVASGNGISFPQGFNNTTNTIQVDYRALITNTVVGGNYNDVTTGLMAECVAFGAGARLVRLSETARVTQEDIGMGVSSTTPGARLRAGQDLHLEFVRLRRELYEQLMATIPPAGKWRR